MSKWLYLALGLAYISLDFYSNGTSDALYLLKPLLMVCLGFYFYTRNIEHDKPFYFTLLAIAFSFLGDTFLMFNGELFFMLGLGSFLVAHVFYILTFVTLGSFKEGFRALPWFLHLFILSWFLNLLWSDLQSFKIPVIVYATVIIFMRISVRHLPRTLSVGIHRKLGYGSLLFILSDFLIALGKFMSHKIDIMFHHQWVMITYILAQFLLVEGIRSILELKNSQG